MTKLYGFSSRSIIHNLILAKSRIAEGHLDSAQTWIDSALQTLLRSVVQDVEAETIQPPADEAKAAMVAETARVPAGWDSV